MKRFDSKTPIVVTYYDLVAEPLDGFEAAYAAFNKREPKPTPRQVPTPAPQTEFSLCEKFLKFFSHVSGQFSVILTTSTYCPSSKFSATFLQLSIFL
ncbi:hypothetical protein CRE_00091 [Caenorhabditis remanei]|uniref:Uncharacterized protein n=1 Tax=Caenorhabditis remanei TaxID=31234 RepID=E3LD41_CAERE|nr:hypothetical protein CRE_00091 [Caenorhabditis remanei]